VTNAKEGKEGKEVGSSCCKFVNNAVVLRTPTLPRAPHKMTAAKCEANDMFGKFPKALAKVERKSKERGRETQRERKRLEIEESWRLKSRDYTLIKKMF